MKKKHSGLILVLVAILSIGFCLATTFTALGSGVTLWLALGQPELTATPTATPRKLATLPSPTPSPIPTFTPIPTDTPTPLPTTTATLVPTLTPSATPTPAPPTATPLPPTATPTNTATPEPSFPFIIQETQGFATSHLNFDVYVAITDEANKPLSGYWVLGRHSSGLQVDSQVSAGDWTVNSGAKHYKAGNIKFEALNSPGGVWTLQLVDESGQPVAPMIDFQFDAASPSWYFILYRQVD